jgi:1,4-alpha-glucan branching enzyme
MVMKEKVNKKKSGKVRVMFTMPAIDCCGCSYLVGRFSEWNESVYRMHCAEDGKWSLALELEPGRDYQYRYRTDKGVWFNDSVDNACAKSTYTSENSVVRT